MIEFLDRAPTVSVPIAEYVRLLGYPRNHELDGRARELADGARDWYAEHGRPWVYARQVGRIEAIEGAVALEGTAFTSARLATSVRDASAHDAVLVAVSAGPELEAEAQRCWQDGRPDDYFFLEVYGSAVVEHLVTTTGARLCAWADGEGLAVLPHDSPGYPDWPIDEQATLLDTITRARREAAALPLDVLDSGMLRPKKSLLAVFGLTRFTDQVRRLTDLVPCERCAFHPCTFRRAPYRRGQPPADPELSRVVPRAEPAAASESPLDLGATYTVNAKALRRWTTERLSLDRRADGGVDAVFRFEGTTCTNTGQPLHFIYRVRLGAREAGYPLLEQHCEPAPEDRGHTRMCRYLTGPDALMTSIRDERPLAGRQLNDVLTWSRATSSSGCYCEPHGRTHKWSLVLETIHYALAREEAAKAAEGTRT